MSQEFYDCIGEWADRCAALSKELAELKRQLDMLLAEAVWAMESLKLAVEMHWAEILDEELEGQGVQVMAAKDSKWQRAQAFLARPDVHALTERQEKNP